MCIFARCLSDILVAKGKSIGSLHTVIVDDRRTPPLRIPPLQIMRLKQATKDGCTMSVTLNPAQLEAVRDKFNLDDEDMRVLKAALLAESGVRLLLDRIPPDEALKIANGIFHMMLEADTETLDTYGVDIEGVRGIDDEMFDELSFPLVALEQEYRQELEPVAQVYDEAVVWLNRAYDLDDTNRRRMYIKLVCSLLDSARSFLASLSLPAEAVPLIDAWSSYIQQTWLEAIELGSSEAGQ